MLGSWIRFLRCVAMATSQQGLRLPSPCLSSSTCFHNRLYLLGVNAGLLWQMVGTHHTNHFPPCNASWA